MDAKDRKVYSFNHLENITINALGEYFCLADTAISLLGYPNGIDPEYPPAVEVCTPQFQIFGGLVGSVKIKSPLVLCSNYQ